MPELPQKLVYVAMSADMIHPGHLNILRTAQELGRVVVGVLTDEAIASYKRLPFLNFEQRKSIVEQLKGVDQTIAQTSLDYVPNLEMLRPDYVVHGDDWKEGIQKRTRQRVINCLQQWRGIVIDVPYTKGISSTALNQNLREIGVSPQLRLQRLQRLLGAKKTIALLGIQTGFEAQLLETSFVENSGQKMEFDGVWLDNCNYAQYRGMPEIDNFDAITRLQAIEPILQQTTKSIIFEENSNSAVDAYPLVLRNLEDKGVSAICLRDSQLSNIMSKIELGIKTRLNTGFLQLVNLDALFTVGIVEPAILQQIYQSGCDGLVASSKLSIAITGCETGSLKPLPIFTLCEHNDEAEVGHVTGRIFRSHIFCAYREAVTKTMEQLLTKIQPVRE